MLQKVYSYYNHHRTVWLHTQIVLSVTVLGTQLSMSLAVSVSSVTVIWDDPATGLVDMYEVTLKHDSATVGNSTQNTRITTFSHLQAGTPYTVIVVAVTGSQRNIVMEKTFYTSTVFRFSNYYIHNINLPYEMRLPTSMISIHKCNYPVVITSIIALYNNIIFTYCNLLKCDHFVYVNDSH